MPPPLAALLTTIFVGYLLVRDVRTAPHPSKAVWIPITWLLIIGSRQVSQWLGTGTALQAQRLEEGSPVDQAVFGALIFAGLCVIASRWTRVVEIVSRNRFLVLLLLYEGLSCFWSDIPGGAFRRWIKSIGDPVMVLVLLSDAFPARAVTAAIARCSYVLIPLSVLFCKYYENLGRGFDEWGNSGYRGVTLDKNMLGYLLFAFGLFYVASLLSTIDPLRRERNEIRTERIISGLLLAMTIWLLSIANSSTAAVTFTIGAAVMVALRSTSVRRHFWSYAVAVILIATLFDSYFSIQSTVAEAAGRDATFTGRTGIWENVLKEPINPLIGTGYQSFWHGERLMRFWALYPNTPLVQAHNGYIEFYINLGLIGLFLLVCVLLSGLRKMRRIVESSNSGSDTDRTLATFALPYGLAYLFYNVTEATFSGANFLFIMFLILACRDPGGPWQARSAIDSTKPLAVSPVSQRRARNWPTERASPLRRPDRKIRGKPMERSSSAAQTI